MAEPPYVFSSGAPASSINFSPNNANSTTAVPQSVGPWKIQSGPQKGVLYSIQSSTSVTTVPVVIASYNDGQTWDTMDTGSALGPVAIHQTVGFQYSCWCITPSQNYIYVLWQTSVTSLVNWLQNQNAGPWGGDPTKLIEQGTISGLYPIGNVLTTTLALSRFNTSTGKWDSKIAYAHIPNWLSVWTPPVPFQTGPDSRSQLYPPSAQLIAASDDTHVYGILQRTWPIFKSDGWHISHVEADCMFADFSLGDVPPTPILTHGGQWVGGSSSGTMFAQSVFLDGLVCIPRTGSSSNDVYALLSSPRLIQFLVTGAGTDTNTVNNIHIADWRYTTSGGTIPVPTTVPDSINRVAMIVSGTHTGNSYHLPDGYLYQTGFGVNLVAGGHSLTPPFYNTLSFGGIPVACIDSLGNEVVLIPSVGASRLPFVTQIVNQVSTSVSLGTTATYTRTSTDPSTANLGPVVGDTACVMVATVDEDLTLNIWWLGVKDATSSSVTQSVYNVNMANGGGTWSAPVAYFPLGVTSTSSHAFSPNSAFYSYLSMSKKYSTDYWTCNSPQYYFVIGQADLWINSHIPPSPTSTQSNYVF